MPAERPPAATTPERREAMAGGDGKARIVLHPRVAKKLAEIENRRHHLAVLIEELETLLHRKRDALLALYARTVGELEYELFRLEVAISELRYRIAFLQRDINLGRTVTAGRIAVLDGEVAVEFERRKAEIERREEELRRSMDYLEAPLMPPEEARALKAAYRRLCRKLHPDVAGSMSPSRQRQWQLVQYAYRAADLELLRALEEGMGGPAEGEAPGDLDAEAKRLAALIEAQKERIARTISSPPFCYESQLRDEAWVAAKRQELKRRISAGEARKEHLQARHDGLLPSSGRPHGESSK